MSLRLQMSDKFLWNGYWTWRCPKMRGFFYFLWLTKSFSHLATSRKIAGSIPDGVTGIFFIDIILLAELWPWGRLSLWQTWVPGIFPGGKSGRCVGLTTLLPSCADCLEIWEPQPPGTLGDCLRWYRNWLTFKFTVFSRRVHGCEVN